MVLMFFLVCLGAFGGAPAAAQTRGQALDFLDDRLVFPRAAQFDSAQYRASGGEARFDQARGQSYARGQYAQAAQLFAQLSNDFPYHSAAWGYLARAFYHTGDYNSARQALVRAGQLMPELMAGFWQPLLRGLEGEVRRQANQLQAQVDYYPQRQAELVPLLRLYRFLADTTAARQLGLGAARRRVDLFRQAEVASGAQRQSDLAAAAQWDGVIAALNAEWGAALAAPEPAGVLVDSLKTAELVRLLQMRVDYYLAPPGEYGQLFGEYMRLGRRAEATALVAALDQEVGRLELLANVAPTPAAAAKFRDQAAAFTALGTQLRARLAVP